MSDTTQFELISPERIILSCSAEMIVVPGTAGYFGVLPRHIPIISTLSAGMIDVHKHGSVVKRIFITGGLVEVTPKRCTVLTEGDISFNDNNSVNLD
ncbi:ATP synthase F1 delta/epsilon subunit [Candidatus Endolissoclinum faulkneri L2]|uniref:ATP synthase epsilon chain n=1 Tax=Candidatus Endolissoclinum faulkneri L2 TaxID=1193729 RepID=K7YH34_9PROT|nr:ATP synthase F1 subunit epsilon [Candidatus Endolissoclinum faulkneri]AFX98865.1 ATP synthase F1 delta/epsilon subunit [Candidatus Endolissoclinum faulkneri L2]